MVLQYKLFLLMVIALLTPIIFILAIHNQLNRVIKLHQDELIKVEKLSALNQDLFKINHRNRNKGKILADSNIRMSKHTSNSIVNQQTFKAVTTTSTQDLKETSRAIVSRGGTRKSVPNGNTSMKTYMDYRTITDKSSKQYKLQQDNNVYTDGEGFRKIEDKFIVAVGTYYGTVGTELLIELSSGTVFEAIIGDLKADKHTDKTNRQHKIDGSVVEFIVDTKKLHPMVRKMGDCSYSKLHNFKGNVVNITVLSN